MLVGRGDFRRHAIAPACLLLVNAVEEVVVYKSPGLVRDPYWRTAFILGCFVVGFGLVSSVVVPLLIRSLGKVHTRTRRFGGALGELALVAALGAGCFWLYYQLYIIGPQSLLPKAWL